MPGPEQSELITNSAAVAMRRHRADSRIRGPKVVMPGGRVISAVEYLKNNFRVQKQANTFADIDEHPERYLREGVHRPGFRYIWVSTKDPDSLARIRSGRYIEVDSKDMRDDSELPYVSGAGHLAKHTHKGPRDTVEIYDVRLCAVSPKAWEELFTYMQDAAVSKIATGTEEFFSNMQTQREATGMSYEVTDQDGNILDQVEA